MWTLEVIIGKVVDFNNSVIFIIFVKEQISIFWILF